MALLAYQPIGYVGTDVTFVAAGGLGDTVPADPNGFVWFKNGSGGSTDITIVVPGTTQGQAHPDIVVSIAAGAERMFGPLVEALADSAGVVTAGASPATSITVAAVKVR